MARSRSIDYRVGFSGDTSQLEAAIKKATESLTKLGTSPDALRRGLEGASRSALELSQHLNTAFNQDTGKLDLIKFQQSLKASGKSIQDYATSLRSLGPQGEQAFLEVASAIGKAELPLKRTNNLIKQFGVTLWNTARWRITTGAINAIVGGMQQAMGYAKSLDSSLNNIRIVTGKSAEEMAAFAKEANSAAKALSTTTTTYTDASLIYYQQGLDTEAVKQRTEATIKMANVTGQSAETISSQMTAIWENFDDGSRSLESFGDAMVALGASTAASSKEIAEGLQKFAPIAQTVGLSFDYASAALTTIVANTRESASVAGTALKTLFSRLEGLKLGETLEDGTDLNKYSSALMAVGINIKDVSGNLKDMDSILDDLGAKWQSLAKDQQLALAETVGGVRQYAQLVALMDNWADFQKNLVTAQSSEGALQRQADIYAESWEAARQRVKAATEDIYDSFINADQFVKLDDMFTPLLTGIASAVDALGGLTGMLPLVVMLMNNAFGDKIAQSLRNMTVNIGLMTGAEQKRARALQQTIAKEADLLGISMEDNSMARTKVEILQEEVRLQAEINSKIDQMPAAQQEALNNEMQMVEILKQEALKTAEIAEARERAVDDARINILSGASNSRGIEDANQLFGSHQITGNHFIDSSAINDLNDLDDAVGKLTDQLQKSVQASVTAQSHISKLSKDFKGDADAAKAATDAARTFLSTIGQPVKADAGIQEIIKKLREVKTEAIDARGALRTALTNLDIDPGAINTMVAAVARLTEAGMDSAAALEAVKNAAARTGEVIQASSATYIDWADALVRVGSYASQAAMAIRAIGNLKDVFSSDNELTSSERLSQGLMSIAMIAPMVTQSLKPITNSFKELSKAKDTFNSINKEVDTLKKVADNAAKGLNAIDDEIESMGKLPTLLIDQAKAEAAVTAATQAHTKAEVEQKVATEALTAARTKLLATMVTVAVIAAVVAAIAILIKRYKDAQEAIKQLNKEKMEAADKAKEEIAANNALIDSYRTLLATYKETGEGKDELDAKARELANVYGIEGAALASLTGNYEDFLDKIDKVNKVQLVNQQKTLLEGASGAVSYNAPTVSFDASQAKKIYDAGLSQYISGGIGNAMNLKIQTNSYDELLSVKEKLEKVLDDADIGKIAANALAEINKQLESARDYINQAAEIEIELKADPSSISSFADYTVWLEKAQGIAKDFDSAVTNTADLAKQAALNLGLDKWVEIQNIQEDLRDSLRYYPNYLEKANAELDKVSNLDDAKVLAYFPWSQVDEQTDNFDELMAQTKEYVASLEQGAQAALNFANAEKLLSKIQSDGKLNAKDLKEYLALFNGDVEEFTNFLTKLSPEEQETQLNNMMQQSFAQQQKIRQERIAAIGKSTEEGGEGLLAQSEKTRLKAYEDIRNELKAQLGASEVSNTNVDYEIAKVQEIQNEWSLARAEAQNYFKAYAEAEDKEKFLNDNADLKAKYGIPSEQDLDAILEDIDKDFAPRVSANVGKYIQAGFEEERYKTEYQDTNETYQLEAAAYERETNLLVDQIKTLGELNKLQKTRKLNTDQYAKGILNLAKTLPAAAKAIKEYDKINEDANSTDKDRADALRKIADIVDQDAWGQAIGKMKDANKELEAAGMKLGKWEEALDPEKYRKNLGEIAEALREVTGATEDQINESWVENHVKEVREILSGEVDAVNSAVGSIRLALYASGQDFTTYAQTIGIEVDNIQNIVSALDGIEFDIHGYADMSQVIANLHAAGATATQIAQLLKYIGNAQVGFEVEGMPDLSDFETDEGVDMHAYERALKNFSGAKLRATTNIKDIPSYSGGGGGGGGSKKDAKDLKKDLKDIEERYHEINRQLERQDRVMTKLDKQTDRTYGTGRLKLFEQQLAEIGTKIELLSKKSEEAAGYLAEDKAVLEGIAEDSDLHVKLFEGAGIEFTTGQEIANYKETLQWIVDQYNAFVDEYTAAMENATEKQKEELEKQKEQEDKIYEARLEALKKYEDSLDQVNTLTHDIEEQRRQEEDKKLEQITYKMKLVLDVREAKKQINDFSKTIEESFGDALTHGAKAIIFDEQNAKIEMDMYKHYLEEYEGLHQRLAEANEFTDTDAIIEELKTLEGNIIESGEALLEWLDTVENMYVEALDAAAERFDWFTNQIAHDTDVLGMIKELYALQNITYKTQQGFDQLQKTSAGQYQGYLRQAQLNREWYEKSSAALQQAQADLDALIAEKGAEAEQDVRYDTLKKNRDALLEEANRAQKAMLENSKAAMETARQMYLDEIDRMSYELEQRMTNNIGFDLLEEKYNHFLEESDRFLDPVEEGLETAAWYTKLQNDINRTSNNLYKDRLKALQEEIDLRRENNTLSQYDLDLLEAKYQVLQAEMALEDARNNKNQLRLVRDSNGNWNYEYTSNPNDLATREEELLKAKQNEYEITKNRYKELNDELLKMAREFAEEDKKIRQDMANGILTEEEGEARLAELRRYYEEKAAYLSSELTIAKNDMSEAAVTSSVLAAGLSESVLATSSDTIQEIVRVLKDEGGPELIAAAGSVFETLQEALKDNLVDKFGETSEEVQQHIKDIIAGENDEGTLDWMTKEFATNMDDIVGVVEDNFLPSIESYIPRAGKAFEDFTDKIEDTANAIGVDPGNLSDMTQELTDDIDNLYYSGMEAISMMWDQLDALYDLQSEYLSWADAVMEVVRAMEELARAKVVPDIESAAGVSLSGNGNVYAYEGDLSQRMAQALYNAKYGDPALASKYMEDYEGFAKERDLAEQTLQAQNIEVGATKDVEQTLQDMDEGTLKQAADCLININDTLTRMNPDKAQDVYDVTGVPTIMRTAASGATGMYTGEFEGGKLGILHEKELVLNEADTRNILEAVHVMRGISDTVFNGIADSLNSAGIASMALLGSHLGGVSAAAAGGTLEQHVTIEQVNFPGVTSSREIEEAFESLVNDAAQWARRRKG